MSPRITMKCTSQIPYFLALVISFSVSSTSVFAQSHTARPVDNNPVRAEQARKIIEQNRVIIKEALIYIAQAEKDVTKAKKLQGEARQYQKGLNVKMPLLKGKALQDAKRQFNLDLAEFSKHVKQYNLHTLEVRKNYGHCKASLDAYEKMKKDLSLHCDQFHMRDIEPPHICVEMGTSVEEAKSMQSKAEQQYKRLAEAEMELAKTEQRLQKAVAESGILDREVMAKSALALKEQELAAEFGRLKEEHRQLDVERKALSRSGVKVGVPSVKGKVRVRGK